MTLNSLGLRSDLFILELKNRVVDRGSYLVVETPSNPEFFWGNLLIFDRPPRHGDLRSWQQTFAKEFEHQPRVRHCTLAWDTNSGETGCADEFVAAGFSLEESIVLSAKDVSCPPKPNRLLEVRPLVTDDEWEAATRNQIDCRLAGFKLELYEPFKRKQMARFRRMSEAGLGNWFGGFLDGRLVGDLGIFVKDDVGRFQSVETSLNFRRQGVCGTLVWQAAQQAREKFGLDTLVMVADENYHAARIYESVGFRPVERQVGVYRYPQKEWRT